MDIKEFLRKFYDAGVDHEATLNPRYSFEKTLTNNTQALQLLQPDVSTSFPNQCKCIGNAGTNCFTGNCTVCGKRK